MIETGFIKTIREIWWDVRPHHNFGTVEVRICDMPPCLEDVLGITALINRSSMIFPKRSIAVHISLIAIRS